MSAGGDKPKTFSPIKTAECSIPIYSNGIDNYGLYGFTDKAKVFEESVTVSARGTIGYVCLRTEPYVPIVRLVSVIPYRGKMTAKYLYLWLLNSAISGTGSTQQQLTVPDFRKTQVIVPSVTVLNDFTEIITPFFNQITANIAENEKLAVLRDTLLPKLINGEIDVSEVDI